MSANHDELQRLVNELGCKPEPVDIQTLLATLIQEQRRTNDVIQNLAESIAQLAHSIMQGDETDGEQPEQTYGGLDG